MNDNEIHQAIQSDLLTQKNTKTAVYISMIYACFDTIYSHDQIWETVFTRSKNHDGGEND